MTETPEPAQLGNASDSGWSDFALDKFVAPEISKFTAASISEISEFREHATLLRFFERFRYLKPIARVVVSPLLMTTLVPCFMF